MALAANEDEVERSDAHMGALFEALRLLLQAGADPAAQLQPWCGGRHTGGMGSQGRGTGSQVAWMVVGWPEAMRAEGGPSSGAGRPLGLLDFVAHARAVVGGGCGDIWECGRVLEAG